MIYFNVFTIYSKVNRKNISWNIIRLIETVNHSCIFLNNYLQLIFLITKISVRAKSLNRTDLEN